MSEYLNKKAVLEWLNEQANNYTGYGHEGTEAIRYIKWRIETSTDFDADDSEIQRLRAALGHIHAIAQSELDDLQYEGQRKTWEEILLTAEEALKGDGNE